MAPILALGPRADRGLLHLVLEGLGHPVLDIRGSRCTAFPSDLGPKLPEAGAEAASQAEFDLEVTVIFGDPDSVWSTTQ